jgi:PST family polysaccharide transporter
MSLAADSLSGRALLAGQWRLANSIVAALSQLAIGVLLARLLTPSDFGVMALASVVIGLSLLLSDLGIGGAVVQRATLTDRHVRSAFTFSVLLGFAVAAAMALVAPLGAVVFGEPRVTPLVRALSIGLALRGSGVVAEALLRRRLDFKRQFFIDNGSYLLGYGGVSVTLALLGYGVWSLVWGGLFQMLLASSAGFAAARHPVRPLLARRELRDILRFGLGAHVSGVLNYAATNGDNFVIGRWLGAANLGLYTRAYTLMNLPYAFVASAMSSVLFPAYAEAQGDPARLQRGYLLATRLTAMVAAPSMGTMAILAPHLVPTLFGHQWTGVVGPLQILCIAGYFRALYHLGGAVAQSVGRVYSEMWRQGVYAALVIGGAILGSRYGLPAIAAGVGVAILFMFIAKGQLALSITGTPWYLYLRVQVGAIVTAAMTCGVALFIRLALEAHVHSFTVTFAVLSGAAVPWSLAMLWTMGGVDFEPLRERLPGALIRIIDALHAVRRR